MYFSRPNTSLRISFCTVASSSSARIGIGCATTSCPSTASNISVQDGERGDATDRSVERAADIDRHRVHVAVVGLGAAAGERVADLRHLECEPDREPVAEDDVEAGLGVESEHL